MKFTKIIAAAGLAVTALVGTTAAAEAQPHRGGYDQRWDRGDRYDRHDRWDRHDRRWDRRHHGWNRGRHYGWNNRHGGNRCWSEWRGGHRVRVCR